MAGLTLTNISKQFGGYVALKRVDLDVQDGEFVVLVGPSGCGKSTLLGIIAGLERPSSGEVVIGGRPVTGLPARDRDIAMVFQSYALYPSMSVRQNITFGMRCRGVPRPEQKRAVDRVAGLLQLEPLLDRKPAQLSGGQRQRVAIGRALVRDPRLFLFDEPLSNLDAKLRVQMRMEIKQLHQQIGKTTVYVTHDQVEAMTLASRVAVMNHGEIQQFDTPKTVYDRPATLFVARFMGSPPMNTLTARVADRGGQAVAVVGDAGPSEVVLTGAGAIPDGLRPEETVIVGVRPEAIGVAVPGQSASDTTLLFDARVVLTEATGAETVAVLDLAGQRLLCTLDADFDADPGEVRRFAFDARKVCLFDPTTERLIGSPAASGRPIRAIA